MKKITINDYYWHNKYYFYCLEPKITKKTYDDIEIAGNTEDLCEMENIQILEKKCMILVIVLNFYFY